VLERGGDVTMDAAALKRARANINHTSAAALER
jgi:hypothetical protein